MTPDRPGAAEAMSDLIATLEAATEGSRELDFRVNLLAFPELYAPHVHEQADTMPLDWLHMDGALPNFTTSLDAALKLVPPEMKWSVSDYCGAFVHQRLGEPVHHSGKNRTPALALTIAALKARQS